MGFWKRLFGGESAPAEPESAVDPVRVPEVEVELPVRTPLALRWRQAMPACLLDFADEIEANVDTLDFNQVRLTLLEEYRKPGEIPLHLFHWYGSGSGDWESYPTYETIPEQLLWEIPLNQLLVVFDDFPLDRSHLEGAARFFGGDLFVGTRSADLAQIPADVLTPLFEHVVEGQDPQKIEHIRRAWGPHFPQISAEASN